jgi:hypothetical protein
MAPLIHLNLLNDNKAEMSLTLAPVDLLLLGGACLAAGIATGVALDRYLRGRARAGGELDATSGPAPLPPVQGAPAMATSAGSTEESDPSTA